MNANRLAAMQAEPNQLWVVMGGIIVAAVAIYFLFMAIDGLGLEDHQASAVITGKEYRGAKQTYRTELVGGVTRAIPQAVPEMYIVKLRIADRETESPVAKTLYDELREGDQVKVVYQQRRITGALQVKNVNL